MPKIKNNNQLESLSSKIINCKKCERLSKYIKQVSKTKVKRFNSDNYWGKPLPGFGDIQANILIIGLAPAAHGGNRTGRMFTGDSSGDWLSKVLFNNGFASKATSTHLNDGFYLKNTFVTAAVLCAPPQNKPTSEEIINCSKFLEKEFEILKNIKIIICLGRIAFDTCCRFLSIKNEKFGHGKILKHGKFLIISSYHPSRQNTQTGKLSWSQWNNIFSQTRKLLIKKNSE